MRILYLCHRIPYPPNKGDKIRAFHQLQAMAKGHEVDLFTLADDVADLRYRTVLSGVCREVTVARIHPGRARVRSLPYLLTATPLTLPYFYSAELAEAVDQVLHSRSYDCVFVYSSAMAQYVDRVKNIPIITDLVDVDSDKWIQYSTFTGFPRSMVYRREGLRLRQYEQRVCSRSVSVLVSTEREAKIAGQIAPGANIQVVSNGVDTDYFRPAETSDPRTPEIVFTGDMSYFPNEEAVVYFARRVFPLIRQSVSAARFAIVGRNPGPRVRQLHRIEGVEVTGFVPDVRDYLANAKVAVAPFAIAAGIQNKILEAMACGLPVVATSRTVQGLADIVAEVAEIADNPREFAQKVVNFLEDASLSQRRGAEGRARVTAVYNWDQASDRLLAVLRAAGSTKTDMGVPSMSPGAAAKLS